MAGESRAAHIVLLLFSRGKSRAYFLLFALCHSKIRNLIVRQNGRTIKFCTKMERHYGFSSSLKMVSPCVRSLCIAKRRQKSPPHRSSKHADDGRVVVGFSMSPPWQQAAAASEREDDDRNDDDSDQHEAEFYLTRTKTSYAQPPKEEEEKTRRKTWDGTETTAGEKGRRGKDARFKNERVLRDWRCRRLPSDECVPKDSIRC